MKKVFKILFLSLMALFSLAIVAGMFDVPARFGVWQNKKKAPQLKALYLSQMESNHFAVPFIPDGLHVGGFEPGAPLTRLSVEQSETNLVMYKIVRDPNPPYKSFVFDHTVGTNWYQSRRSK